MTDPMRLIVETITEMKELLSQVTDRLHVVEMRHMAQHAAILALARTHPAPRQVLAAFHDHMDLVSDETTDDAQREAFQHMEKELLAVVNRQH